MKSHESNELGDLLSQLIQRKLNGFLHSFETEVQRFLKNLNSDEVRKSISLAKEAFFESLNEGVAICQKYDWPISESFPPSLYLKVISQYRNGKIKQSEIDALFVDYLSYDNFDYLKTRIMAYWESNDLIKKRMDIFYDCVNALQNGNSQFNPSNVVVPTLISQIDGILSDFFGKQLRRGWKETFQKEISNYEYSELLNNQIGDVLFESSYYKSEIVSRIGINRHKILHGEELQYGTLANSMRLFLIIDHLSIALKQT